MGIGQPVRVLISGHIDSPCVAGWLRPVILMPAATLLNLSVEQLEAILAHELAHIRRQDYLVNLLQTLAETLFFYQPGVWWVSSQIRRERELCCDDMVVELCGDAVGYARALTRLERLRVSASDLAMSSNAAPLLHRIQRLAGIRDEQPPSKLPAGLALCLALLCFATSMNWANAQSQPGREGVVKRDAIWVDTVKRGDVPIVVRALGNLTAPTTVELQVAAVQAKELRDGQAASIEFRSGKMMKGTVSKIDTHATNGTVRVRIVLQEPASEPANEPADGMIQVRTLNNVVYVGRPAGSPAIEGSLFKLDADGNVGDAGEGAIRRAVRTERASSRRPAAGRPRHPQRYGQVRRLRSCQARVIRRSEKLSPEENGRRSFVGGAAVFAKAAFLRDPDGGGILGVYQAHDALRFEVVLAPRERRAHGLCSVPFAVRRGNEYPSRLRQALD